MKQSIIYIDAEGYSKRKLGFGYIIQCNFGDDYGIVYGVCSHKRGFQNVDWIYYFKKYKEYVLPNMSIISFVSIYDSYEEREDIIVDNILLIDEYQIINDKGNDHNVKRQDGVCHSEIVWKNMMDRKGIIAYDDNSVSVYFPYSPNDNNKKIFYLSLHYYGYKNRIANNIVECFVRMKEYEKYKSAQPFNNAASEINDMIASVETTDIKEISKLFSVRDIGYFLYRPGRDDDFIYYKNRISKCNDPYINSLTQLGIVDKDYYNCVGQGMDDQDYDRLNKEDTRKMRKEIISKYNKDKHFEYLLTKHILDFLENRDFYISYSSSLKEQGNVNDMNMYLKRKRNFNEWLSIMRKQQSH